MDEQIIECVREIKLVGVIISDDLKWGKNTRYICQKAMGKIWTLRRMKGIKLDTEHMLETYVK